MDLKNTENTFYNNNYIIITYYVYSSVKFRILELSVIKTVSNKSSATNAEFLINKPTSLGKLVKLG